MLLAFEAFVGQDVLHVLEVVVVSGREVCGVRPTAQRWYKAQLMQLLSLHP